MRRIKNVAFAILVLSWVIAEAKTAQGFDGWTGCGYLCWEYEGACIGWSSCEPDVTLWEDCEEYFCATLDFDFSCDYFQEGGTGDWRCTASCECVPPPLK